MLTDVNAVFEEFEEYQEKFEFGGTAGVTVRTGQLSQNRSIFWARTGAERKSRTYKVDQQADRFLEGDDSYRQAAIDAAREAQEKKRAAALAAPKAAPKQRRQDLFGPQITSEQVLELHRKGQHNALISKQLGIHRHRVRRIIEGHRPEESRVITERATRNDRDMALVEIVGDMPSAKLAVILQELVRRGHKAVTYSCITRSLQRLGFR